MRGAELDHALLCRLLAVSCGGSGLGGASPRLEDKVHVRILLLLRAERNVQRVELRTPLLELGLPLGAQTQFGAASAAARAVVDRALGVEVSQPARHLA